jgi:two-component system response regulator YesN
VDREEGVDEMFSKYVPNSMTRLFKVVLIEERSEFRKSVREYIERNFSPVLVIEIESGERALELMKMWTCDIVLLDIDLPGMDGIEMVRRIKDQHPRCIIIIFSNYQDVEMVRLALQAGASGFVAKHDMSFEFEDQIERLLDIQ